MRRGFIAWALVLAACGGPDEVVIDGRGDAPDVTIDGPTVDSDVRGTITVRVLQGGRQLEGADVYLLSRDETLTHVTTDLLGVAKLDGFAGATVVVAGGSGDIWMWRGLVPPATITVDKPPRQPAMGGVLVDAEIEIPSPPPGVAAYEVIAPCLGTQSATPGDPVVIRVAVHTCAFATAADVWVVARDAAGVPLAYSAAVDADLTVATRLIMPAFRPPDEARYDISGLSPQIGARGRLELERLGEPTLDAVELYPAKVGGFGTLYSERPIVGTADRSRVVIEAAGVQREIRHQPAATYVLIDLTPPPPFPVLPADFHAQTVGAPGQVEGVSWTPLFGEADGVVLGFSNLSLSVFVVTPFDRDGVDFGPAERGWILTPFLASFMVWDADDGGYGPAFVLDGGGADYPRRSPVGANATWMSREDYPFITP